MQHNVLLDSDHNTQLIAPRSRIKYILRNFRLQQLSTGCIDGPKRLSLAEAHYSVRAEDALQIDLSHIRGHVPLLAVCYGANVVISGELRLQR
jgi:GMP synthase (glutamine-hydrolysing)